MIVGRMIDSLGGLNVPVTRFVYNGTATTYITIEPYFQKPGLIADDVSEIEEHYLQVNIFSKGNYRALSENTKTLLEAEGFIRIDERDNYEADTKYFHKVFRFLYRRVV